MAARLSPLGIASCAEQWLQRAITLFLAVATIFRQPGIPPAMIRAVRIIRGLQRKCHTVLTWGMCLGIASISASECSKMEVEMTAKLKVIDGSRAGKPGGVRQERARERRKMLIDVVMDLVKERGFAEISVNEVAERASLSVGGLYRHIDTKNDLLEMICDEINRDLLEDMKGAAGLEQGAVAKLEAAIRTYWQRHWDASDAVLLAYREFQSFSKEAKVRYRAEENSMAEYLSDLIRAGMIIGDFREVDDRLMANEILFLSHMRALKGYVFKGRERDAILTELLEFVFSRLRAD
ncbi:TetR/AcrR family transcriptional regulator [Novosphingobium lubricantis]